MLLLSFSLPMGDWFLFGLLLLPVVATLLSLVRHDHWVWRIFDFPRLQIAAISLLCMLLNELFQQKRLVYYLPAWNTLILRAQYGKFGKSARTRLYAPNKCKRILAQKMGVPSVF